MGKAVVYDESSKPEEGSLEGQGVTRMTATEHVRPYIAR